MNFLQRNLDDPVRLARIKRWCYLGLAAIALAEIALPFIFHYHSHFWFEDIPAWGSVYGFASCVAIIVGSKLLGKVWLMKREKYYE